MFENLARALPGRRGNNAIVVAGASNGVGNSAGAAPAVVGKLSSGASNGVGKTAGADPATGQLVKFSGGAGAGNSAGNGAGTDPAFGQLVKAGHFSPPGDPHQGEAHVESLKEKRERIRKKNLAECCGICIFSMFVIVFTITMLLERSSGSSRLAAHIRGKLDGGHSPLASVTSTTDVYSYLENVFIPAVYETSTDTNIALDISRSLHPIDVTNRILGAPRIRQVRVKLTEGCQVTPMFEKYTVSCYPVFSSTAESTDSFGPDGKFSYSQDSDGTGYTGALGGYNGHGYMQSLTTNRTLALQKVQELRQGSFLGAATRAVFIDFTVWNSNTGVYAVASVIIEFGASGGVRYHVDVLTLNQRSLSPGGLGSDADWLSFIGVIIVMIFVLWFMYEEIQEIWQIRWSYLKDVWNIVDWVNLLLVLVAFAIRCMIFSQASGASIGQAELVDKEIFKNYRSIALDVELVRLLNSFNFILSWVHFVKYLRHLPTVRGLISAVWDAFDLFLPFLLMLSIAFIGFAMSYNIGFGDKISELSTFSKAVIYLCRAFLRDVKLMPAYHITPVFGAMLILLFYVTLVLGGCAVLFAIIADALFRAKYEMKHRKKNVVMHEDEPLEEFCREVLKQFRKVIKRRLPSLYRRLYPRHKKSHHSRGHGHDNDSDDGDGHHHHHHHHHHNNQHALEDEHASGANGVGGTSKPGRPAAGLARAIQDDDGSETDESVSSYSFQNGEMPTREELLRAVEHMSGRMLSEISIVGIEIKSELHDVCERVAQMQMAVEELTWRTDLVRSEQEEHI